MEFLLLLLIIVGIIQNSYLKAGSYFIKVLKYKGTLHTNPSNQNLKKSF